jgi:hypothetical protein
MMRRVVLWAVVAVTMVGSWAPVSAQTADEGWNVLVAPYLTGAAMNGTTGIGGFTVDVDMSASDIFSKLQFGAMGLVLARKGDWGFGGDFIWMALGTTVRETNVDVNQGAFAFYGLRRLGAAADLTFGARINTLQGEFKFKDLNREVSGDRTWADPMVGVVLHSPLDRRFLVRVYSEIGGFGLGSDLAWQVFPIVGLRVGKSASLEVGYRWLDLDYKSGEDRNEFAYDVLTQGPVVGFGFWF